MSLTLSRLRQIQRELEIIDVQLDALIADCYRDVPRHALPSLPIGELSRMHQQLVEELAKKRRELMKG